MGSRHATVMAAAVLAAALAGCGGSSKSNSTSSSTGSANGPSELLLHYEVSSPAEKGTLTLASAGGKVALIRPKKFQLYAENKITQCKSGQPCTVRATGRPAKEFRNIVFGAYLEPGKVSLVNKLKPLPTTGRTVAGVPSVCRVAIFSNAKWVECTAKSGGYLTYSQIGKTKTVGEVLIRLLSAQTHVPPASLEIPQES